MVIRGHQIFVLSDGVGDAVVAYIYHDIDIVAANGFGNGAFRFTGTETGILNLDLIRISLISFKCKGFQFFMLTFMTPLYKPVIYLVTKVLAAY